MVACSNGALGIEIINIIALLERQFLAFLATGLITFEQCIDVKDIQYWLTTARETTAYNSLQDHDFLIRILNRINTAISLLSGSAVKINPYA